MIIVQVYRDINWVYILQVSVYTYYIKCTLYDEVKKTIQIVIGVSIILMILMIMTQCDYYVSNRLLLILLHWFISFIYERLEIKRNKNYYIL